MCHRYHLQDVGNSLHKVEIALLLALRLVDNGNFYRPWVLIFPLPGQAVPKMGILLLIDMLKVLINPCIPPFYAMASLLLY